jgi:hypothetical protein
MPENNPNFSDAEMAEIGTILSAPDDDGTQPAEVTGPAVTQPQSSPTSAEWEWQGKKWQVPSDLHPQLTELQKGYLRQQDYTRKTQGIRDERMRIANEQAQLQDMRAIYDRLQSDPSFFQRVQAYIQGQPWQQDSQDTDAPAFDPMQHPVLRQTLDKVNRLESALTNREVTDAQKVVADDLKTLREKYPGLAWDEGFQDDLLQAVVETNQRPSDVIWVRFRDQILEAEKSSWQRQMEENATKKKAAAVEPGQGMASTGGDVDLSKLSGQAFDDEVAKELKAMGNFRPSDL